MKKIKILMVFIMFFFVLSFFYMDFKYDQMAYQKDVAIKQSIKQNTNYNTGEAGAKNEYIQDVTDIEGVIDDITYEFEHGYLSDVPSIGK